MTIFKRIFNKLKNWMDSEDDNEIQIDRVLKEHDNKIENLKNALANLMFQKARLEEKKTALENEILDSQRDLEEAVKQSRDELALHIIGKIETSTEDLKFLNEQILELSDDIESARMAKQQVEQGVLQYREKVKTLGSKMAALKARTAIKKELGAIRTTLADNKGSVGKHIDHLNQKITQMTVELEESNDSKGKSLNQQIEQLREGRQNRRHQEILEEIKNRVNFRSKAIVVS